MATLAEQAVDAIAALYGRHPACRAAHAKGTLCSGTFTPSREARAHTVAPQMQEASVPVTVRLSSASGDPAVGDDVPDVRGMAVRFQHDEAPWDLLAITLPCFMVRTPEHFVTLNRLVKRKPGAGLRAGPGAILFLLTHPETWRGSLATLKVRPVTSFADCRFNSIHSFKWIDARGKGRWLRYRWAPVDGEASLPRDEATRLAPDQLERDLYERLAGDEPRPLRFRLELHLAPDGLPAKRISDATSVWPASPERTIDAGLLEIDALDDGSNAILFDPMRLPDGVEPSDDPILRFRPSAYDVSFRRRTSTEVVA